MKKAINILIALSLLASVFSCSKSNDEDTISVESVSIDGTATLKKGETKQLNAVILPAGITTAVEWTSSDDKIATVSNGLITAVAKGDATITAKAGNKTATCKVTVTETAIDPEPAEYGEVTTSWASYVKLPLVKFGDASIEDLNGDIEDFTSDITANITKAESEISISVDQDRTGATDKYIIEAYIDWNGDGDFSDEGEKPLSEKWTANGKKTFTAKVTPPANCKASSRVRVIFYFDGGDTDIEDGVGNMDSGKCVDFIYKIK